MRARIKKRQRTRNITIVAIIAVVVVLVIAASYFLTTLNSGTSTELGQPVSSSILSDLSSIAQSSSYGPYNPVFVSSSVLKPASGGVFSTGKPIILYIGGEFCPLCAFQRWPLVITLMRFGNLTGLTYMQSSAIDSEPNTYTFSFVGYHYSSKYIVFEAYEQEDRSHNQLQTVPQNYTAIFNKFGAYPFIDFNNKYTLEGSYYVPDTWSGLNWTQIIQQIRTPNSPISIQVMSAANALTAVICNLTGETPTSICNNPSITALPVTLASYNLGSNIQLTAGTPDRMPERQANSIPSKILD